MKRKPEEYLGIGFYECDMDCDIQNPVEKVVKCRMPHECMGGCGNEIKAGDYALRESGFMDGRPVSNYTCIPCLDAWLDEIEFTEDEDGVE